MKRMKHYLRVMITYMELKRTGCGRTRTIIPFSRTIEGNCKQRMSGK